MLATRSLLGRTAEPDLAAMLVPAVETLSLASQGDAVEHGAGERAGGGGEIKNSEVAMVSL